MTPVHIPIPIGSRFGKWVTISETFMDTDASRKSHRYKVTARCDCGNIKTPQISNLKSGKSASCGCVSGERLLEWRKANDPDYGKGWINPDGYHKVRVNGTTVSVHRLVMEEKLGRPLLPDENVHHKNLIKGDNDPGNLELWITSQPSGARVTDLMVYYTELAQRYPDELAALGFKLEEVTSLVLPAERSAQRL